MIEINRRIVLTLLAAGRRQSKLDFDRFCFVKSVV